MQVPTTENEWESIAENFYSLWQFPHCIGAMDGKHAFNPQHTAGHITLTINIVSVLCCWLWWMLITSSYMKKDYSVLLIQLDGNLASDVSTRCSGRPQGNENWC